MGNAIHQIRAYLAEMLQVTAASLAPLAVQVRSPQVRERPRAAYVVERVLRMQTAHADELAEHLQRLGAAAAIHGSAPEFTEERVEIAAEAALRADYATLSLAQAAALMLETNARTLGFSSTAALAARHREEIVRLLVEIRELLPLAA